MDGEIGVENNAGFWLEGSHDWFKLSICPFPLVRYGASFDPFFKMDAWRRRLPDGDEVADDPDRLCDLKRGDE